MKETNTIKKSFIASSLTTSAGIFITKLIGLFYIVPFKAIVGQQDMIYYSAAFDYYTILLQICSAGIPFALAALVAKYLSKNDYKTVILVRILATSLLMVSGFAMAVLFIGFSGPLAARALGGISYSANELAAMQNSFVILAMALFLVSVLYSYRGYYQGAKEMQQYSLSQVIEQFVRVGFLLGAGWFVVYILHLPKIVYIYTAVGGTGVGAMVALLQFMNFDRKHFRDVQQKAKRQSTNSVAIKELIREFVMYVIPFLLSSILANSQVLVNTNFFVSVMEGLGMQHSQATMLLSIIQTNCDKLTSIPQVIGNGFAAGAVPFITVSLVHADWKGLRKSLEDCLGTVFYIVIPVCVSMAALSGPIYYIMYGAKELEYGQVALFWSSILAFGTTVTPVLLSILLSLKMRRHTLIYFLIGFLVKVVTFYPCCYLFGYSGAIISSILCEITFIALSIYKIQKTYPVRVKNMIIRLLKIIICCFAMNGIYVIVRWIGIDPTQYPRLLAIVLVGMIGSLGMGVYFASSELFRLPKSIFHRDLRGMFNRILRRGA
ncbi:polysaccharide biosynthesis C-terminal domain-containing protein [Solobacterium moorei]|uniref:oligosaccharide flippase family protein n=1 Tax=Solobacterium moorei TaxID=102148 RepID=UPI00040785E4|nr:polysaccharide biosynthesis C-terminal domain-containing protein [Solobacterium moorei]BET21570.1 polysaccharide biosynthesis protein [Solobacterium moorei]